VGTVLAMKVMIFSVCWLFCGLMLLRRIEGCDSRFTWPEPPRFGERLTTVLLWPVALVTLALSRRL
jgi:hypothetical protein